LYPTFSSYLPSIFMAQNHEMARVIGLSYLFSEGMFGLIVGVVFTLLVVYLFFAQLLAVTGTGKIIIDAAYSLTATVRGGAAKVAIMASGGFGMISGSVPSNVMSTGVFTIPLMKKTGFAPTYAAAIEAVAATGGGLTPPIMGAVAFIMAEILNVGYGRVIIVAALPAVFYYFSLFMQIDCRAGKAGLKGLSRAEIPPVKGLKKQIWFFLAPIATLLILLIVFNYSAVTSGIYATVVLILISQFKKDGRVTIQRMADALNETTKTLAFILPVCATAGLIIANIMLTGLGIRLSQLLVSVAQGHMLILLVMAWAVNFILGTGLPAQTSYLLLAVLVAPSLIQGGIHPMAAHLFIIWSAQIAYITPPEGMGFYTAAAVAGANPMQTGWLACRLGIVAYILPFAFAINTHLMLIGGMRGIAGSIVMTTLGVVFLASGLEGYLPVLNKRLGWVARVLFLLGGGIFVFGYSWFVGGTLK